MSTRPLASVLRTRDRNGSRRRLPHIAPWLRTAPLLDELRALTEAAVAHADALRRVGREGCRQPPGHGRPVLGVRARRGASTTAHRRRCSSTSTRRRPPTPKSRRCETCRTQSCWTNSRRAHRRSSTIVETFAPPRVGRDRRVAARAPPARGCSSATRSGTRGCTNATSSYRSAASFRWSPTSCSRSRASVCCSPGSKAASLDDEQATGARAVGSGRRPAALRRTARTPRCGSNTTPGVHVDLIDPTMRVGRRIRGGAASTASPAGARRLRSTRRAARPISPRTSRRAAQVL